MTRKKRRTKPVEEIMVQLKIGLPPDLRQMLGDVADDENCTIAEAVRRRLWSTFGGDSELVRQRRRYEAAWLNQ